VSMLKVLNKWYERYLSEEESIVLLVMIILSLVLLATIGDILAPLLASIVLAYLVQGVVNLLTRLGLPPWLGFSLAFTVFMGAFFAVLLGLEIGGLVAASAILFGRGEKCGYASSLAWLLLWPVALTFFNIVSLVFGVTIGGNSLFGGMAESIMGDLLVLLIFAALFWVLSVVFLRFIRQEERVRKLGALFFMSVATGYSVLFVWFLLHAVILDYYFASMVALVLYAVVASFLYVAGTVERRKWMKGFGIAMIVLVLARLFLVEYWAMEDVVTKIITFFVVGSMLIAASLLAGKFRTKRSDDGASINDASL